MMQWLLTSKTLTSSSVSSSAGSTDRLLMALFFVSAMPRSMNIGATCAKILLHPLMRAGRKLEIFSLPKVAAAERSESKEPKPTMLTLPAAWAARETGGYSIGGMSASPLGAAAFEGGAATGREDMAGLTGGLGASETQSKRLNKE